MNIEKYKALLCAIEKGSLSAAGEELGYTPSGMSRMIASIEEETGLSLLIRGRNGAVPTKDCQKLMPYFSKIILAGEELQKQTEEIQGLDTGHIAIGNAYAFYYDWLAETVSEFCSMYPSIRVTITDGASSELVQMLKDYRLDIAIVSRRQDLPMWIPLKEDRLMVMVPSGHPAAQKGIFSVADLKKEPFIEIFPGKETDESIFFRENNIKVNVSHSVQDNIAAASMVRAGLGIAMINETELKMCRREGITAVPLDPAQRVELGIGAGDMETACSALKKFLGFIMPRIKEAGLS